MDQTSALLSERTRSSVDLRDKRLGFYYISTLDSNDYYFDLLDLARKRIDQEIAIVAPIGGSGDVLEDDNLVHLEKTVSDHGYNYIADGKHTDRGHQVTVINPHVLPPDTFLSSHTLSHLPVVVTGDQSLTESIQRSIQDSSSSFLYYCYIRYKQGDVLSFIDKIDPEISHLLASYFVYELPKQHLDVMNFMNKAYPHFDNPASPDDIARLFYDPSLIQKFHETMKEVPAQLIRDRKGFVEEPEKLVNSGEPLEVVLDGIRTQNFENVQHIMSK